ncbi:transcriptional regulator, SARP family protein [Nocardiopsis alba ATCC BAA-2165]|uniref:Transcriptional regulator, SARP family protein n=1 Tax=Nocardiopsis alba (strain ATCC BAA-2165 / BE74) TaxID=1205910 RepID=J7LDL3_NOCAA|nr:transcriptional regulator, SARP family protein [Nocardiopsis alba ATCC BAA-2165]
MERGGRPYGAPVPLFPGAFVRKREESVNFTILGALEILKDDRECTPKAPKVLQVLALLLLRANHPLPMSVLVRELWGDHPPKSAVTTVQTYVCQLRKAIEEVDTATEEPEYLLTRSSGYLLRVSPEQVDALVFQRLLGEGRRLLEEGRTDAASKRLGEALDLWSGPCLAHVSRGPLIEPHAVRLEEQRLHAQELRIRAELLLGRERESIGELRSLAMEYPLNEWFHGRLIHALHRAGRRDEASTAYRRLRLALSEELGLEPSLELQTLHQEVLGASPAPPEPRRRPRGRPEGSVPLATG